MNPRTQIILVLAVLLGVASLSSIKCRAGSGVAQRGGACCLPLAALETKPVATGTSQSTTNAVVQRITAYYFHGTVRCETCLKIERQARAVIEQQFGPEMAAGRLRFLSINYDEPENRHFTTDYRLPCPSLVLVRQQDGQADKWKLLGETWKLVEEPLKFNEYVTGELRSLLNGQDSNTNEAAQTATPSH